MPPERLVYTFVFEVEGWRDRAVLVTAAFEEWEGKTKFTQTILHQTVDDRDAYLKSGMERGAAESYEKLVVLLLFQTAFRDSHVRANDVVIRDDATVHRCHFALNGWWAGGAATLVFSPGSHRCSWRTSGAGPAERGRQKDLRITGSHKSESARPKHW